MTTILLYVLGVIVVVNAAGLAWLGYEAAAVHRASARRRAAAGRRGPAPTSGRTPPGLVGLHRSART